jgi:hypothetical protein
MWKEEEHHFKFMQHSIFHHAIVCVRIFIKNVQKIAMHIILNLIFLPFPSENIAFVKLDSNWDECDGFLGQAMHSQLTYNITRGISLKKLKV